MPITPGSKLMAMARAGSHTSRTNRRRRRCSSDVRTGHACSERPACAITHGSLPGSGKGDASTARETNAWADATEQGGGVHEGHT